MELITFPSRDVFIADAWCGRWPFGGNPRFSVLVSQDRVGSEWLVVPAGGLLYFQIRFGGLSTGWDQVGLGIRVPSGSRVDIKVAGAKRRAPTGSTFWPKYVLLTELLS